MCRISEAIAFGPGILRLSAGGSRKKEQLWPAVAFTRYEVRMRLPWPSFLDKKSGRVSGTT
jgi:hypothetical protein